MAPKKRKQTDETPARLIGSPLTCPVCMDVFLGEIYQCPNGHILCGDCKSKIDAKKPAKCPECRIAMSMQVMAQRTVPGHFIGGSLTWYGHPSPGSPREGPRGARRGAGNPLPLGWV
jgi:hypothetical protein